MINKKLIPVIVIMTALFGVGLFFFVFREEESVNITINNPDELKTEIDTQDNMEVPEAEQDSTETEVSNKKQPVASEISVDSPPKIYTTYGHRENSPVPEGETVKTTCTTAPNVDCFIKFTSGSGDILEFEAKRTDENGIASWNWSGKDIPSGKWTLNSVVGDFLSDKEIIYVE